MSVIGTIDIGAYEYNSSKSKSPDQIGAYQAKTWTLDVDRDGLFTAGSDARFTFGLAGAIPVWGDWNGDGTAKIGVFIDGYWYLDYNGDSIWDGGATDKAYQWGAPGDAPIVGVW